MQTLLHRASSRGFFDYGWLRTYHSFSFAEFFDPQKMGFGLLRVLNDDTVRPGFGFDTHAHTNMEIITIVLSGELEHKDSKGNVGKLEAGMVQTMSAGIGIQHSEKNPSSDQEVNFFQIWIRPKLFDIEPTYKQMKFDLFGPKCETIILVDSAASDKHLTVNQACRIAWLALKDGDTFDYKLSTNSSGLYCMVAEGSVSAGDIKLNTKDALGISEANEVTFAAEKAAKVLVIEVPMK
ncbi:MAG: pirin family protein [Oligoflexales bacterium]